MASYRELAGALGAMLRAVRSHHPDSPMLSSTATAAAQRLLTEAAARQISPTAWTPFERAAAVVTPAMVVEQARHTGQDFDTAKAELERRLARTTVWTNSRYQVMRTDGEDMIYLSIKRLDQQPIREWRDLQRIKNEIVGPEHEGMEVYPAESRKADSANQYHLYVLADAGARFPVGFAERLVEPPRADSTAGQAPFEAGDPWNAEGAVA
jgi:hypothetical protein